MAITATLEDSLAISYKGKHTVIIFNSEPGVLGIYIKELKMLSTQNLHRGAYSIYIFIAPTLK